MKSLLSFFIKDSSIPFEDEILESIKSGNINELSQLFETKNIDPKLLTKQGLTLMTFAAYHNKTEVIKYLHSIGCDANQTGKNGSSPLTRACYYKRYDSIKILLDLGANINTKYDEYPLVQSLYRGNDELIQFLLDHGADTSILHNEEYQEVIKGLPENIKLVIRKHDAFKRRIPFLMIYMFKNDTYLNKLPRFVVKELVMFI
ncbi:hypothetical protein SteCoe_3098 [Stentor coeruleus]|uniref:Peptidase A2 domain-containing protein n=1 Tax=Stentor coeruleus TaxID=5963 RepID=A0A1R2CY43_9CILI|nr:hypothetical protein SteCoe_3098 [Stentor coeruleus]